jgi:hypothetical protein
VCLRDENARPHVAASTPVLLNGFSLDILAHLCYNLGLAIFDYHLFMELKETLVNKRFHSDEEAKQAVINWTKELARSFYACGGDFETRFQVREIYRRR